MYISVVVELYHDFNHPRRLSRITDYYRNDKNKNSDRQTLIKIIVLYYLLSI